MTIIQPHKNKYKSDKVMLASVAVIISMAILSVFFYNANVDLGYLRKTIKKDITGTEAENAELQDDLYQKLDFKNVNELAVKLGLIKENSPKYLLAFQPSE